MILQQPARLILWDIDGTLAVPSLERGFVAFLLEQRLLTRTQLGGRAFRMALHWPLELHRMKLPYVRHEPVGRVREWVDAWWAADGVGRLLPGATQALCALRERGVESVLLSGTADFLAERMARHFGISKFIAGRAQMVDGCYTGELLEPHPHGSFKLEYAERFLAERPEVWEHTWALGDHVGDIPLLARAGMAMAVNAHPGLRAHAQHRGWPVVTDEDLPAALLELM